MFHKDRVEEQLQKWALDNDDYQGFLYPAANIDNSMILCFMHSASFLFSTICKKHQ